MCVCGEVAVVVAVAVRGMVVVVVVEEEEWWKRHMVFASDVVLRMWFSGGWLWSMLVDAGRVGNVCLCMYGKGNGYTGS